MSFSQKDLLFLEKNQKFASLFKGETPGGLGPKLNTEFGILFDSNVDQKRCLQQFMKLCMKDGKRNKSYHIVSQMLYRLSLIEDVHANKGLLGRVAKNRFLRQHPVVSGSSSRRPLGDTQALFQEQGSTTERLGNLFFVSSSIELLMKAIEQVKPLLEVKKVRISGTTQLVPSILSKKRQINIAIRWLMEAASMRYRTKKNRSLEECFLTELIEASQSMGSVRKKRDDLHRLAESNRSFAHYRWWSR